MSRQKLTPEIPNAQARTSVPTFIREFPPPPSTKIFLKPDRNQIEVFSTSNYNGYEKECQGSLSNQNLIDLLKIISVFFFNIYLLACPYRNDLL